MYNLTLSEVKIRRFFYLGFEILPQDIIQKENCAGVLAGASDPILIKNPQINIFSFSTWTWTMAYIRYINLAGIFINIAIFLLEIFHNNYHKTVLKTSLKNIFSGQTWQERELVYWAIFMKIPAKFI